MLPTASKAAVQYEQLTPQQLRAVCIPPPQLKLFSKLFGECLPIYFQECGNKREGKKPGG